MEALLPYLPSFINGFWVTIFVSALSIIGMTATGVVLGVLRTFAWKPIRILSEIILESLRGASAVIYLFWVFYALPMLPGGPKLTPIVAAVTVLSLEFGAYAAEVVRAGIESVSKDQKQAAYALNLSKITTIRRVVLPQALTQIVPGIGSLAVDAVRATSLVGFIGVADLFYQANAARQIIDETTLIYTILMITYCIICFAVFLAFRVIEEQLPEKKILRLRRRAEQQRRLSLAKTEVRG